MVLMISLFVDLHKSYAYRGSSVIVTLFCEGVSSPLDIEFSVLLFELLSMKKPGSLGSGNFAPSLDNIRTTELIVGLSSEYFWTHNKPTWMHFNSSDSTHEFLKHWSISSNALPSFHNNHACNNFTSAYANKSF